MAFEYWTGEGRLTAAVSDRVLKGKVIWRTWREHPEHSGDSGWRITTRKSDIPSVPVRLWALVFRFPQLAAVFEAPLVQTGTPNSGPLSPGAQRWQQAGGTEPPGVAPKKAGSCSPTLNAAWRDLVDAAAHLSFGAKRQELCADGHHEVEAGKFLDTVELELAWDGLAARAEERKATAKCWLRLADAARLMSLSSRERAARKKASGALDICVQEPKELQATAFVPLGGSLDPQTVITVEACLNSLRERGVRCFILDLENLKYINGVGLGCFLNLSGSVKGDHGGISLVKVHPKVHVVFEMLGLDVFFKTYPTIEAALKEAARLAVLRQSHHSRRKT